MTSDIGGIFVNDLSIEYQQDPVDAVESVHALEQAESYTRQTEANGLMDRSITLSNAIMHIINCICVLLPLATFRLIVTKQIDNYYSTYSQWTLKSKVGVGIL